ncbi:MAG: hypothetical protein RJA02_2331, partial [Armatimonadota bacterium]
EVERIRVALTLQVEANHDLDKTTQLLKNLKRRRHLIEALAAAVRGD